VTIIKVRAPMPLYNQDARLYRVKQTPFEIDAFKAGTPKRGVRY